MKCLFCTGRAHLPEQGGGAERSIDTLLQMLVEESHPCEAVVALRPGWRRQIVRRMRFLSAGRLLSLRDRRNGYLTHRTGRRWVVELLCRRLEAFQPEIIITQLNRSREIAETALARGMRVVLMVRDAEFDLWTWPEPHPRLKIVSNSNFVARRLREHMGLDSIVLYPPIRLAEYYVADRESESITFVNPVSQKGLDLALAIAPMLPHRRFLFVEGSRLDPRGLKQLRDRLKPMDNVTFIPWTPDMRQIYARTAILIVPSKWEEAFGRVALEAHVSGIPVIGRDIGGLSEILRDSGTLLAPDASAQLWAETIERLLSNIDLYAACSAAAKRNAERPIFDPKRQMERFLSVVSDW